MENRYSGLCCPVCKAKFFDDDDIVVCPVCGAPHHRECYKSLGHCALEETHGTENQWTPSKTFDDRKDERSDPNPDSAYDSTSRDGSRICPRCGANCNTKDNFCPVCGYDFVSAKRAQNGSSGNFDPFGGVSPFPSFDPLGGVPRDALIDGQPAEDVAAAVSVNSARYTPKFASMKKSGKKVLSWNWAAFLLSGYWFFYRKCYVAGAITTAISIACSLLLYPFENLAFSIVPQEYANSYSAIFQYIGAHLDKVPKSFLLLALTAAVIGIIKSLICGLFGDYIYKRRCISSLNAIKSSDSDDIRADIARKGGANIFIPIIVYMAVNFLQSMLIYLL